MTWLRKVQVVQVVVIVALMLVVFVTTTDNWIEGFIDSVV